MCPKYNTSEIVSEDAFPRNIVSNMSTFTAVIKHLSDRQKIALFQGLGEVARDLSQHTSKQN